jgi:phosphate transport system protein
MSTPDPLEWLRAEQERPSGTRMEFQQRLAALDASLIGLAEQVAGAVVPVTTAFLEADAHAAGAALDQDQAVRRGSRQLEDACYGLLARESPVAGDLRRVVAVLRCAGDVQRASNLLRHVAESLTWVHPPSMPEELRTTIRQLGEVSAEIFDRAVAAWRIHDGLAAPELEARDDQVDLLQKVLLTELYTGRQSVEESVSLALIARYYERIADHGVELARQVAYVVTGDRVPSED